METYITLSDAAQLLHATPQVVAKLAECGKIKSAMLQGDLLLSERDVRSQVPVNDLPEYQRFSHLAGICISISEASRRYNVSTQTISRWVQRGYIARLGQEGRAIMIDEAQVATFSTIYQASEGGQGHWVFRNGAVHHKKPCN